MSAEPLTSWRACAIYARSLLECATLDPQLAPHLQALQAAMAQLQLQEATPQAPPPIPAAPSPWTAPGGATPAPTPWAQPEPAPVHAPVQASTPAPQPAGAVATQGEAPLAPMTVFTFGSNDKGALGHGFQRPPAWEPAREVNGELGAFIAAHGGAANCAFITRSGQLLLSGSNGTYLHADRTARGRELPTAPDLLQGKVVSRVFFGATTTHIFALLDGRLWGWGRQTNALGIDLRSPTLEPKPVERIGKVSGSGGVPGEHIRQLVLSAGHSTALLADGSVWMTGMNARGQLGIGMKGNPYELHVFSAPEAVSALRFQAVACSTMHSACISVEGHLYTCGRNDKGELGHVDPADHFRLTRVATGSIQGRRVAQVSCGEESTYCITEDGALHVAGNNERGALGLGDVPGSRAFVELKLPDGGTVRQVAGGAHHALALMHDGRVFAWGANNMGQVTPGESGRAITSPRLVKDFAGKPVVALSTGADHSLVMLSA